MQQRTVYFVSDRTGITATTLANCLLTQFENINFLRHNVPFLDTEEKAQKLVSSINSQMEHGEKPLVFCTVVDPEIRAVIATCDAQVIDFFDAFISPLETELGVKSTRVVGKSHGVNDYNEYKNRIDAINYALNNDDGTTTRYYDKADIIIVGVSRCGKTPTCLYLAVNYGIFAANYPLTEEDLEAPKLPQALQQFKSKLYGLSIDAHRLQQIRSERRPNSRYAKLSQCQHETQTALCIYKNNSIPYSDTSAISIEEIASLILHHADLQRRVN